jgi:hypothetical protein
VKRIADAIELAAMIVTALVVVAFILVVMEVAKIFDDEYHPVKGQKP